MRVYVIAKELKRGSRGGEDRERTCASSSKALMFTDRHEIPVYREGCLVLGCSQKYSCDSDQLNVTQRRDRDGPHRHNINHGYSSSGLKVRNGTFTSQMHQYFMQSSNAHFFPMLHQIIYFSSTSSILLIKHKL